MSSPDYDGLSREPLTHKRPNIVQLHTCYPISIGVMTKIGLIAMGGSDDSWCKISYAITFEHYR
jgi:hypothetical protein